MKIEPTRVGNVFANMTEHSLSDQWRGFVFSLCEWHNPGLRFLSHTHFQQV